MMLYFEAGSREYPDSKGSAVPRWYSHEADTPASKSCATEENTMSKRRERPLGSSGDLACKIDRDDSRTTQ